MRGERRTPHRDHTPPGAGMAAGIGAALLVIACCAGPSLIAAGTLGAPGGIPGNPWVITVAATSHETARRAASRSGSSSAGRLGR